MFRIPWISEPVSAGIVVGKAADVFTATQRQTPAVGIQMLSKLKRKRANSDVQELARPEDGSSNGTEVKPKEIDGSPSANPASGAHLDHRAALDATTETSTASKATAEPQSSLIKSSENMTTVENMEVGDESDIQGCSDQHGNLTDSAKLTPLQQTIEAQFGLEILLKHNELRLIDQELAKCQIALEQLRRCSVIPFPTSESSPVAMTAVSSGSGPAIDQDWGGFEPEYPAPWGVTDGPYTRHYAKWLIPDPKFDGGYTGEANQTTIPQMLNFPSGRSTRGSHTELGPRLCQPRSQRGSIGSTFQALPTPHHQPKEKAGPLIIKRTTDNQYVKLVCLDCERGDFSSAQGFINHCRIAHHRGFESHDAAAIACGQILDRDETVPIVEGGLNGTSAAAGFVHPLIKSASPIGLGPNAPLRIPTPKVSSDTARRTPSSPFRVFDSTPKQKPSLPPSARSSNGAQARQQSQSKLGQKHGAGSAASTFVPSPQTPHLSALMRQRGFASDLSEMVSQAKVKIDLGLEETNFFPDDEALEGSALMEESEDKNILYSPGRHSRRPALGTPYRGHEERRLACSANADRIPTRAGISPAPFQYPITTKGLNSTSQRPQESRARSPQAYQIQDNNIVGPRSDVRVKTVDDEDTVMLDINSSLNQSPNTVESNPAPSLVSDDGDYEVHSESESPDPTDLDDEDEYLGIGAEDDAIDQDMSALPKAIPPRRASALKGELPREGFGGRHVAFVTPTTNKKHSRRRSNGEEKM